MPMPRVRYVTVRQRIPETVHNSSVKIFELLVNIEGPFLPIQLLEATLGGKPTSLLHLLRQF